ncbi:MAG: TadE/TadG family type IV pilus assembly protein [Micrococcales bacterium]
MPKLATLVRRAVGSDRGAISTLFAILLGSGLLIAIIGMVVDTGQVLAQRQLVRNAADAVAEAVAFHCAKESPATNCLTDNYVTTGGITGTQTNAAFLSTIANPKGGNITVTKICGKNSTVATFPACPVLTTASYDCKANLAALGYSDWVRVYTSSDPTGIKAAFMPFVSGSHTNYQELGCAQVWWGKAASITVDKSGNQLPVLFGNCDVNPKTFGTLVPTKEENDTTTCTLTDWFGATRTSTTHGMYLFNPYATSTACWNASPPSGSTACPRVLPTNVVAKTATTVTTTCDPTSSYPCLVKVLKAQLGKTYTLPVVEYSGSSMTIRGFVNYTLLGYQFPTKTSPSVTTTAAQGWVTSSTLISQSKLNTVCPTNNGTSLLPNNVTVPCIAGVFSAKTTSGFNQGVGAAPSSATTIQNLGYQMVMHIN